MPSKLFSTNTDIPWSSFETHDVCEEVIKEFDGTPVCREGGEEHIIHIRFADTHDQKMLKQQTAAARQFRAAEFEYGCLQAGRGTLLRATDRVSNVSPAAIEHTGAKNDFEQYMQHGSGYVNFHQTFRLPRLIDNRAHLPHPLSARTTFLAGRPSLPTIKSDPDSTAPQVNLPSQSKVDGGVSLPSEENESQLPKTPNAAHGETSTTAAATTDQN